MEVNENRIYLMHGNNMKTKVLIVFSNKKPKLASATIKSNIIKFSYNKISYEKEIEAEYQIIIRKRLFGIIKEKIQLYYVRLDHSKTLNAFAKIGDYRIAII